MQEVTEVIGLVAYVLIPHSISVWFSGWVLPDPACAPAAGLKMFTVPAVIACASDARRERGWHLPEILS